MLSAKHILLVNDTYRWEIEKTYCREAMNEKTIAVAKLLETK